MVILIQRSRLANILRLSFIETVLLRTHNFFWLTIFPLPYRPRQTAQIQKQSDQGLPLFAAKIILLIPALKTNMKEKSRPLVKSVYPKKIIFLFLNHNRERSYCGSVVECLTRDRGAAGSSLTVVTVLWSLSKTHLS